MVLNVPEMASDERLVCVGVGEPCFHRTGAGGREECGVYDVEVAHEEWRDLVGCVRVLVVEACSCIAHGYCKLE